MAAMFSDDPNELNKRYMPNDGMYEDDEEEIPEEELTEGEKWMVNTLKSFTAKDWQMIIEAIMDEEDYTLSREEYGAKVILAKLNSTNLKGSSDLIYKHKLSIANLVEPEEAVLMVERLKKKPEEGANIPPDILDMIYKKAKEYKG
jgi:hypothetical protein